MPPGISRVLEHIATKFQPLHLFFSGSNVLVVELPVSWDVDVCSKSKMGRSQITGSTINFAGFTDIHVVPKSLHGFMTMSETSKCLSIMADDTPCRKSKMTAN